MKHLTPFHHALLRADLWRLLALTFAQPTPAALTDLRSVAVDLHATLVALAHPLATPVSQLAQALSQHETETLEQEYHALFSTQVLVSPYEGAYQRRERGAVLGDVSAFYTAFGLQVTAHSGPPDALQHELAFLSWLAVKEAYALEHRLGLERELQITREATRRFLEDHLGCWVAAFTAQLLHATDNPVYGHAAWLLVETVALAAEEVGPALALLRSKAGAWPAGDARAPSAATDRPPLRGIPAGPGGGRRLSIPSRARSIHESFSHRGSTPKAKRSLHPQPCGGRQSTPW